MHFSEMLFIHLKWAEFLRPPNRYSYIWSMLSCWIYVYDPINKMESYQPDILLLSFSAIKRSNLWHHKQSLRVKPLINRKMPQQPTCTHEITPLDFMNVFPEEKKIRLSAQGPLLSVFMTFLEPFGECRKIDTFMKPSRWPRFAPTQAVFSVPWPWRINQTQG